MATETTTNATSLQTDYLSLLVTQLQNQDPMSPMSSSEMTGQLSQLYQLQALESMDGNFGEVLASVQQSYATSLVGKEVEYGSEQDDGETTTGSGQVTGVNVGDSSDITLKVGDQTIGLADVISVGNRKNELRIVSGGLGASGVSADAGCGRQQPGQRQYDRIQGQHGYIQRGAGADHIWGFPANRRCRRYESDADWWRRGRIEHWRQHDPRQHC